jgi:hypothetical protein
MNLLPEWQGTRFCPGGYPFTDGRTGYVFDAMAGGLNDRVADVMKHRRANPNLYPPTEPKYLDRDWIRLEIIDFMCAKRPELCGDLPLPKPQKLNVIELPTTECQKCGATNWKPIFCPTCGGNRITGFECQNCHAKI